MVNSKGRFKRFPNSRNFQQKGCSPVKTVTNEDVGSAKCIGSDVDVDGDGDGGEEEDSDYCGLPIIIPMPEVKKYCL